MNEMIEERKGKTEQKLYQDPEQKPEQKPEEKVIFEPEAYMKALLHVLRFASKHSEQETWVEVYGWLVGRLLADGTLHIVDAVPLHHGKDVEVAWDANTYVRAAEFDEKLFQQSQENPDMEGLFIVGWYHSHPGLDFFLSGVDINNHLYFQGQNPKAVAIVFDHTKIVPFKHLGFKIFKLDEPTPDSGFHEVKFETSLFTQELMTIIYGMMEVVQNIQEDRPFSTEYGEVPSVFTQLMLPGAGAVPSIERKPPIDLNALFDKIIKSTNQFTERLLGGSIIGKLAMELNPALEEWFSAFIPYFTTALNRWLVDLAEKILITNKLSLGSVYTLAVTLKKSLYNITSWLKMQVEETRTHIDRVLNDNHESIEALIEKGGENVVEKVNIRTGEQDEQSEKQYADIAALIRRVKEQQHKNEELMYQLLDAHDDVKIHIATVKTETNKTLSLIKQQVNGMEGSLNRIETSIEERIINELSDVSKKLDRRMDALEEKVMKLVKTEMDEFDKEIKDVKETLNDVKKEVKEN